MKLIDMNGRHDIQSLKLHRIIIEKYGHILSQPKGAHIMSNFTLLEFVSLKNVY